jgi:hypothetical protein
MQFDDMVFKRDEMRKIILARYGNICMANYEVTTKNPLQQHHLDKVADGGKTTVNNISSLTNIPHSIVNILDREGEIRKLKEINDALRYYKECLNDIIRQQLHHYLEAERVAKGYDIYDNGKLLILRRR